MKHDGTSAVDEVVDRHFDEMVALRRHLHMHPEASGQEFETSLHLYQLLGDRGFEVQMGPEGRGVVADAGGPAATGRLALRADIDALRIHDRKTAAYRSRNAGLMHACGHDAHTAIVFGALVSLGQLSERGILRQPIAVRGIFQPAEETATGAREMIAAGVLEQVGAILATHVDPTRAVGHIGLRAGVLTSHSDSMIISIHGRGGHAARPHESNDPIAAAAQLISTLYLFVPRAADSQDAIVVTIGQIEAGHNPNVIPERVVLSGTLRTLDAAVRQQAVQHICQLTRGIEQMSGTKIDVRFEASVPSVCNDSHLSRLVETAAHELLDAACIETIPRPSMGSEDFAEYLRHVPGAMFRLGVASAKTGCNGLHTPTFDIDEGALAVGAKILARAAIRWSESDASPPHDRAPTRGASP